MFPLHPGGHHQDGEGAFRQLLLDPVAEFLTGHAWHLDVGDQCAGRIFQHLFKSRGAVGDRVDLVARPFQAEP